MSKNSLKKKKTTKNQARCLRHDKKKNYEKTNNMELHIKDRIYIPQLLPAQNSFMEYNLKREIIKKVALTEKDKEEYAIVEDAQAGKVTWDSKKDMEQPLVVDFSKQEIDYLKKSCEALAEAAYPDDLWATVEKIYNAANA